MDSYVTYENLKNLPKLKSPTMVAAWAAKDREAAIAAAPWEVIEDTFIFGSPEEMRERLRAFVAGGITLPILTPITMPDRMGELIERLAPQ